MICCKHAKGAMGYNDCEPTEEIGSMDCMVCGNAVE
jgi:hypothetical protein